MIYVILQVLVFLLTSYILYRQVLKPKAFSIVSSYEFRFFILFNIVVLLGFGSILAYNLPDTNSVLKRVMPGGYEWGLVGVLIFLFCWLLVSALFNAKERSYNYVKIDRKEDSFCSVNILILLTSIMVASTLLILVVYGIPQKAMFSGMSAQDLAVMRTSGLHNSTAVPTLIRRLFAKELSIVLSFIFLARVVLSKNRKSILKSKAKLLLLISFFCAVYHVSFELSKSKLVAYLLIYYLLYCSCKLRSYKRKTNLSSLFLTFVFLFGVLVLIFSLTYPDYDFQQLILYLISRLFVSQISPYYYSVGLWVNDVNIAEPFDIIFYLGEVFKLADFQAPAQRLTEMLFYDAYISGRMNYLSSFLMGDAVSMFGFYSVPFFSLYIAFLLRGFFFIRCFGFPKDLFFGLGAAVLYGSNFMSSLFPFILSSSVVFIVILSMLASKRTFLYLPK